MKRILEILTYIDGGGAEMVVYNYLSHMNLSDFDIDIIAIDKDCKQTQEDAFKNLGCNVIYIPKSIPSRIDFVRRLIKKCRYDIIHAHCHFLSEFYLLFGKMYGVKTRIKHVHIANPEMSSKQRIVNFIEVRLNKIFATHYFACGKVAYESYWGKYDPNNPKSYIMNNAVDIDKFRFSTSIRNEVRQSFDWQNDKVYFDVARFTSQKNHFYLIKIFKAISQDQLNARLVLIGMGELIDKVKEYVHEQGLGSKVEFLGNRNDVPRILNGCDCFLLPSLFEGLPVVGIEAQANGLPILFSDTITRECDITDNAEYLPINDVNIVDWANHATKANCNNRESYAEQVAEAGYSIDIEAKKLFNFYKSSK